MLKSNNANFSNYMLKVICILIVLVTSGCERTVSSDTPNKLLNNFVNALQNKDKSALIACFDQASEEGRVTAEMMAAIVELPSAITGFTQHLKEKYPEAANDSKYNSFAIENPFAELVEAISNVDINVEGDRAFGKLPRREGYTGKEEVIKMVHKDEGWLISSLSDDISELKKMGNAMKHFAKMFDKLTTVLQESSSLEKFGSQFGDIYLETIASIPAGIQEPGKVIVATEITVPDSTKSEPSILKVPVKQDLNWETVEDSIRSAIGAQKIKKLGELPFSAELEAMTGKPTRFIKIYLFGDLPLVKKLIDYNPAYSAYLPARIVLAGDNKNMLWIYTLDLTTAIQHDGTLPEDVRTEAIAFYRSIQDIVLSSAGAKNKSQFTVHNMPSDVSIFKKQANRELDWGDIEMTMNFVANEYKLRNTMVFPVSAIISAMLQHKHADPQPFLKVYMYNNMQTAEKLIVHNPGYSLFLPYSIAIVGDKKDMLWAYFIDLEHVIQKDSELPDETRREAMQFIENIRDLVSRGAEGNF